MNKEYCTDNMSIASYLDIHGLEYLGCGVGEGRSGKPIVVFKFSDDKGIARDLERSFRNSNEKKYRESLLFFRNEVFKTMEEGKYKGVVDNEQI